MKNILFVGLFTVAVTPPFVAWTVLANIERSDDLLVPTSQGTVRGSRSTDGRYGMYMGIPFATVNTDNPFGDPLPGPIFEGVFTADDDSAMCPQREEFNNTLAGTLDCLHVNVYVPTSASIDNPLPVMVWIYGGGFTIGAAGQYLHGPEYIVRHDVILVTLNYRLGLYGFMCVDIPSVPGNAGLKDQRAGLRWVKENIGAFGGDVNSITVFGESAGALSIDFHILSTGSNGLFHRAILQSGTAFLNNMVVTSTPSAPLSLAGFFGFNPETVEEALEIIKDIPTEDLIRAGEMLEITFSPCIEQLFDGVENIILDYPKNTFESGNYESIPILVGYNNDELLASFIQNVNNDLFFDQIQDMFFQTINGSFVFESENEAEAVAKIVQEFYIGSKTLNGSVAFELSDFQSDLMFSYPGERLVTHHLANSVHPIYQYLFAYSGDINLFKRRLNITAGGALHADEIGYLFKQIYLPHENNPEDQRMIDQMTTMWTNYAKYGDPVPETSELLPVRWPAATRELREFLYIDSELVLDRKPFHSRMAFWDLFFLTYGSTWSYGSVID